MQRLRTCHTHRALPLSHTSSHSSPTTPAQVPTTNSSPPRGGIRSAQGGLPSTLQRTLGQASSRVRGILREPLTPHSRRRSHPTPDKIKYTQHGSAPTAQPPQPVPEPQSQSFPAGCMLFARHVPADTNKTALRTRFSALLADPGALDYVGLPRASIACVSPLFVVYQTYC